MENELLDELQKQQDEFFYEITKRRVLFEENVIVRHKEYIKKLFNYIADAKLKHIISAPFIWSGSIGGYNDQSISGRMLSYLRY